MEEKKISFKIISLLNQFFKHSNALSFSFYFLKQSKDFPMPLHITFLYQICENKEIIEGGYEYLLFHNNSLSDPIMDCKNSHQLNQKIHDMLFHITIEENEAYLSEYINGITFDKKDWKIEADRIFNDDARNFFINDFYEQLDSQILCENNKIDLKNKI